MTKQRIVVGDVPADQVVGRMVFVVLESSDIDFPVGETLDDENICEMAGNYDIIFAE
jgi:hypothetical protein